MRTPVAPSRAWPHDPRVFYAQMDGGIAVSIPTPQGGCQTSWAMGMGVSSDDELIRQILFEMEWPLPNE